VKGICEDHVSHCTGICFFGFRWKGSLFPWATYLWSKMSGGWDEGQANTILHSLCWLEQKV